MINVLDKNGKLIEKLKRKIVVVDKKGKILKTIQGSNIKVVDKNGKTKRKPSAPKKVESDTQ